MPDFVHRELSRYERWVSSYEGFVNSLAEGYDMCIYEYTNDLSCRQRLEDARSNPQVQQIWARVERADALLRDILKPTKECIHGSYPREYFWFWGYPPGSPELESDLKSIGAL
jgi:hypothetical protein